MPPVKTFFKKVQMLCLVALTTITTCKAVVLHPNASIEHVLHKELIKYSPTIRPVLSPEDKINVSFSAKLLNVIELDNKKQMVTTKFLIIQRWENQFLKWDPVKFGGIDWMRMSHKEVWVPDIKLQNNPDNPSLGYTNLPLYKNWVNAYSNGTNVWISREMIDSECNIDVGKFPFDNQTCFLNFTSESYDSTLLTIHLEGVVKLKDKDVREIPTGEWHVKQGQLSINQVARDPLPFLFSQVSIEFRMERQHTFYLFYYIVPCGVLAMLMFASFIIPPENGERIGFCSSLLIALSVYLLLFSELLPNTRNVSVMGVFFVVVYLETALALLATVVVLKAYHAMSPVPKILRILFGGKSKKSVSGKKSNKIKPVLNNPWKRKTAKDNEQNAVALGGRELEEVTEVTDVPGTLDAHEETQVTEDLSTAESNQRCWSRVARALDRMFFWIFLLCMSLSMFYIISYSENVVNISVF